MTTLMRAALSLVLLTAGPASAQDDGGRWLDGADRRASVQVRLASGERVSGRVFDVRGDTLLLASGNGPRTIERAAVVDVRQRHHDSVGNGAVIGAAIGGATLLGIASAVAPVFDCDGCAGRVAIATAAYAGAGAGIGALVDAAIRREVIVYQRPLVVSWAPVVAPRQAGVRLQLRF